MRATVLKVEIKYKNFYIVDDTKMLIELILVHLALIYLASVLFSRNVRRRILLLVICTCLHTIQHPILVAISKE